MSVLTWEYRGRDSTGKAVKGRVEAQSEASVLGRLRTMGVAPTELKQVGAGSGLNREINISFLERGVKLKDLSVMSRQMATMIGAGISLLLTLTILADQTQNKKLAKTLGQVRNDVETGFGFSQAMAKHDKVFPPLMINLIRAGEAGGFLEKSLASVADNYEREVKLSNTIKSAMTYPVVVLIISILAVIAMLIFIVPVFEKMFKQLGGTLPLPTQVLVWLSHVMVWLGPVIVVAAIAFAIWWRGHKNQENVRQFVDPWRLRLPVFGPLSKKIAIARFTRNFSTMVGSGVPILQSLAIVGETSGNYVIQRALKRVADSVRAGKSIAAPLALEPVFPPMVTQMLAVGENAGSMEVMLDKIADFYDDEVEATTSQLTSLIEPLMIVFLGVVIGGMIVALYMPIFGIIAQVQQSAQ